MRTPTRLLMFAALAALGACHRAAPTPSADVATISVAGGPQQAPGLWSQTISDKHGARSLRYCLDAASAGAMAAFNRQLGGRCSRHDIAEAAETLSACSQCRVGSAAVTRK